MNETNKEFVGVKIEEVHTVKDVRGLIVELMRVIEVEWGDAIDKFGNAVRSGHRNEIEMKKKELRGVRSKVLKWEESLLAREKDLVDDDKDLKKTMKGMRKAYNFSKQFGDQFLT